MNLMEFNKVLTVVYQGSKLTLLMTYSLVLIQLLSVTSQGSGVSKGSLAQVRDPKPWEVSLLQGLPLAFNLSAIQSY